MKSKNELKVFESDPNAQNYKEVKNTLRAKLSELGINDEEGAWIKQKGYDLSNIINIVKQKDKIVYIHVEHENITADSPKIRNRWHVKRWRILIVIKALLLLLYFSSSGTQAASSKFSVFPDVLTGELIKSLDENGQKALPDGAILTVKEKSISIKHQDIVYFDDNGDGNLDSAFDIQEQKAISKEIAQKKYSLLLKS